jgi:calcium-binding protein CML
VQTVFSWILLVQRISKFYYKNPGLRPPLRINHHLEKINLNLRGKYDLSDEDKRKIEDVFNLIDIDGCGSIDADELDAAMYALGYQVLNDEKQRSVKQEQSMDLEQFSCMMTGEMASREPFEDILTAFQVLSQEKGPEVSSSSQDQPMGGIGKISIEGLRHASIKFQLMFNEDELLSMIQDVDTDGSNSVGIHQFIEIMANAPWF